MSPLRLSLVSAALVASLTACGSGTSVGGAAPGSGPTPTPQATASNLTGATATPNASPGATSTATSAATATAAPAPSASPSVSPTTTPSPGGSSPSSIYLGDIARGAVLIYSSNASGSVSPSAIIAGSNTGFTDAAGSSPIYGIAVDEGGSVYVLTQTTDATHSSIIAESIFVFAGGTTGDVAPARTIALPTSIDAESLAYSASTLYVTDDSGAGAIDVYASGASGSAPPERVFTDGAAFPEPPLKVSIDASGDAYVATYDETATSTNEAMQGVYEFSPTASGAATPTNAISGTNTGFPRGVLDAAVVDSSLRIDAVLDDSANDIVADIDEFASGATANATPATAFQDGSSQGPVDAALDGPGNLYVSEIANSTSYAQVSVYAPGATAPQQTILAYEGVLPLIAIGPYVATSPSGAMPLSAHRLPRSKAILRRFLHVRAIRALWDRGRRPPA